MTPYVALIVLALLVPLVPALMGVRDRRAASGKEARTARARETADAQAKKDADEARQEALWESNPTVPGVADNLDYRANAREKRLQAEDRAADAVDEAIGTLDDRMGAVRDGKVVSRGYVTLVLGGLTLFVTIGAVATGLDYLVFRGLHPDSGWPMALGLALIAVVALTVGSIVALAVGRHREGASTYSRRLFATAGVALCVAATVYVASVAPYRSAREGNAKIATAEARLRDAESAVPKIAVEVSQAAAAVRDAQRNLKDAQRIDRISAVALAVLEVPLAESAILGWELVLVGMARRRHKRALKAYRAAVGTVDLMDARYLAELTKRLAQYGHGPDVAQLIIETGQRVYDATHAPGASRAREERTRRWGISPGTAPGSARAYRRWRRSWDDPDPTTKP
jgi:hypothetical protein